MPDPEIPEAVLKSLNRSGFPFQTAVAQTIRNSKGWHVHASEYPWWDLANSVERFLDIVAVDQHFVLTVECKKTAEDTLTFLRPRGGELSTDQVLDFRCRRVVDKSGSSILAPYETWSLFPPSPVSEFCVVGTSGGGKKRLLENDAAILVRATDAFATDLQESVSLRIDIPYTVLPVIVTNAKIYTARYKESEVSLESGQFEHWPEMEYNVPWVRFAKTFTADPGGRNVNFRTVFVVSANCLQSFLEEQLEHRPD